MGQSSIVAGAAVLLITDGKAHQYMFNYDNFNVFVEIKCAGVKVIMAVPCNVGRPSIVAGAVTGILEYYYLGKHIDTCSKMIIQMILLKLIGPASR